MDNVAALTLVLSAIGTITGVVGAWTGISSNRKVHKMTQLDLRMKHGDIHSTVQVQLDSIRDLSPKANESRINRLAAQGMVQSGSMQKWKDKNENYIKQINQLSLEFRGFSKDNSLLTSEKLAAEIQCMTLIQKRVQTLNDDLKVELSEDEDAVAFLRKIKFGT